MFKLKTAIDRLMLGLLIKPLPRQLSQRMSKPGPIIKAADAAKRNNLKGLIDTIS